MSRYSLLDKLVIAADQALKSITFSVEHSDKAHSRANPADKLKDDDIDLKLSSKNKLHSAKLMRINRTGEVCAQALYRGQALMASSTKTKDYCMQAAQEEHDHLVWCSQRLKQLENRASYLDWFWYVNSFLIGAVASKIGDQVSLGFVVETEKQVGAHLQEHLSLDGYGLAVADLKSRKILEVMHEEELEHAQEACHLGGKELPKVVRKIMQLQSKFMTSIVYYI